MCNLEVAAQRPEVTRTLIFNPNSASIIATSAKILNKLLFSNVKPFANLRQVSIIATYKLYLNFILILSNAFIFALTKFRGRA